MSRISSSDVRKRDFHGLDRDPSTDRLIELDPTSNAVDPESPKQRAHNTGSTDMPMCQLV